jgi:hypothetical protein
MKPHNARALILVGWYLMLPPLSSLNPRARNGSAPLSEWSLIGSFDSADECDDMRYKLMMKESPSLTQEDRKVDLLSAQCISTDDPRLKEM